MNEIGSWLALAIVAFAGIYFLCGLDDLVIDFFVLSKDLRPKELSARDKVQLTNRREKKIAILVPAWKESNIISQMLRGNIDKLSYDNYHFFVGCYPNDLPTYRAVSEVARETGKVTPILNVVPGPTSKGQLLNSVLHELLENHYPCFDIYLFHDAEDIIHPLSLRLINSEADKADFIQIPVFSLPVSSPLSVGATYMDEFAEVHTRDLLVRKYLDVSLPSAGVGFALTRKALFTLFSSPNGQLFDSQCLTEDYALGLRAYQTGLKQSFPCVFERTEGNRKDWIATYEYFPKKLIRSIRQKARWTEGIALQSAKKFGWFGGFFNCLFLFRDRKALLANCLGLLGLAFFPVALWTIPGSELSTFTPLFVLNSLMLLNRMWHRGKALRTVYKESLGVEVIARYPLSVMVNGFAGFLAMKNYGRSVLIREPTAWVKTEHELPVGFGQVVAQGARGAL
ncbi:MAG: hypothetical protein EBQ92_10595 [Proteobacteria bacterium]|nr:hypothetical protein [Pseudomonadota bacterium]